MKLASYPQIGTKVRYIRQIPPKGDIEIGEAIIEAICLDMEKRLMAHLAKPNKEADQPYERFNVDLSCLEPSEHFVEKFKKMADTIIKMSMVANAEAKAVVDEANQAIDNQRSHILGRPIEFESLGNVNGTATTH